MELVPSEEASRWQTRMDEPITRSTIDRDRDDYPERYSTSLAEAAETALQTLRLVLVSWRYVAADACDIAHRMDSRRFRQFVHEVRRERRGDPSGKPLDEDFLEMRMPTPMLIVSVVGARLGVPWGSAFHHLLSTNALTEVDGRVRLRSGVLRSVLGQTAGPNGPARVAVASLATVSHPMGRPGAVLPPG